MKTKKNFWLTARDIGLARAIISEVTGCTSGPLSSDLHHSPTGSDAARRGGNHTQPVYKSSTVAPAPSTLTKAPD